MPKFNIRIDFKKEINAKRFMDEFENAKEQDFRYSNIVYFEEIEKAEAQKVISWLMNNSKLYHYFDVNA